MRYLDHFEEDMKENCNGDKDENQYTRDRLSANNSSEERQMSEHSRGLRENKYRYSAETTENKRASNSRNLNRECRGSTTSSMADAKKDSRRCTTGGSNHTSSRHSKATNNSNSNSSYDKTIALFGVNGVTGHYFLQLAVEAGYHVRAMIIPGFELEDMKENPNLTLIHGTMDDVRKIHRVIRKAAYVVCMLTDCPQPFETTRSTLSNYEFIQNLVPLMAECAACKVLLYQATSFASDGKGSTPVLPQVVKKIAVRKSRREALQEQDKVIRYITKFLKARELEGEESPFHYIVTRPSEMVWDRPSRKKLAASKSLPGPFPITNIDLAEFSLNALKMDKLYNTCPYVVQDGL